MIIFITIISNYIDKKTNSAPIFFNQLVFLKKHYFLLACLFGINIFSMIGLPPFAGFWGKFYILLNIIQNINDITYIVILVVIIITSIISAYAYLIILKKMFFFSDLGKNTLYVKPISKFIYICIISLFIWSCFLWINII
jgi:NADH-quinone oxidoreductase subunit N